MLNQGGPVDGGKAASRAGDTHTDGQCHPAPPVFPRPAAPFRFKMYVTSITPMCLVSSDSSTNPHATISILSKADAGALSLSVHPSASLRRSLLHTFSHRMHQMQSHVRRHPVHSEEPTPETLGMVINPPNRDKASSD